MASVQESGADRFARLDDLFRWRWTSVEELVHSLLLKSEETLSLCSCTGSYRLITDKRNIIITPRGNDTTIVRGPCTSRSFRNSHMPSDDIVMYHYHRSESPHFISLSILRQSHCTVIKPSFAARGDLEPSERIRSILVKDIPSPPLVDSGIADAAVVSVASVWGLLRRDSRWRSSGHGWVRYV